MAPSINWATKVITIPQADLSLVSGNLYELDVDAFRLDLKNIEDDVEGMVFPATHRHNTQVVLAGVTYARTFEIINGYTVTFQDTGNPYTVRCVGANHNLADVVNYVSEVSLIVGNSAGLQTVVSGSGVTQQDKDDIVGGVWTNGYRGMSDDGNQEIADKIGERELDSRLVDDLLKDLLALATGRIVESPPGVFTYYGRDNVTPRFVLQKTGNERVRS